MSMKLNKKERLAKDLLGHLQDPEFQDVKIICSVRTWLSGQCWTCCSYSI